MARFSLCPWERVAQGKQRNRLIERRSRKQEAYSTPMCMASLHQSIWTTSREYSVSATAQNSVVEYCFFCCYFIIISSSVLTAQDVSNFPLFWKCWLPDLLWKWLHLICPALWFSRLSARDFVLCPWCAIGKALNFPRFGWGKQFSEWIKLNTFSPLRKSCFHETCSKFMSDAAL